MTHDRRLLGSPRIAAALRVIDERAATRSGLLLLGVVAIAQYAVVSLAWPLRVGRDFISYARAYDQLFDWSALFPWIAMQRPPVAPLVIGGALDLAGGWGAEAAAAVLFAVSVVAWAAVGALIGPRVGVATAVVLLVFPGYAALFHQWSADAVFACGFAVWSCLVARSTARPSGRRFALAGGAAAVLTLTRPTSFVLVGVALVAALVESPTRRLRLVAAASVATCALLPLAGWAALNGARFDDLAISRGSGSTVPLFRAFVTDRIVEPDNGPASRRLAALVEHQLLNREPYRSRGIDVASFFGSGSPRMHEDLVSLSDARLGWDSNYALLRDVGREAVRAHPGTYLANVARDVVRSTTIVLFGPAGDRFASRPTSSTEPTGSNGIADAGGRYDGQAIPAAHQGAYLGTPDNRIVEVWKTPTSHGAVFLQPGDRERSERMEAWVGQAAAELPTHGNVPLLARTADRASRLFPPLLAWLALAVVAAVVRRPRGLRIALYPAVASACVMVVTVAAVPPVAQYSIPLAPAFIVLGLAALLGPRARPRTAGESH